MRGRSMRTRRTCSIRWISSSREGVGPESEFLAGVGVGGCKPLYPTA